jgi:hypothetical protein
MTNREDHIQPSSAPLPSPTLRRRGMLAAVAALAAGGLAKATATPVLAGTDGDLVLGTPNIGMGRTTLNAATTLSNDVVFLVDGRGSLGNGFVDAIYGFSLGVTGYGVSGTSAGGRGGSFDGGQPLTAGPGGYGVVADGGTGFGANFAGGVGLGASGGLGGSTNGAGGAGVTAIGGGGRATNGSGGAGITAGGGFPQGSGTPGIGIRSTGGGTSGASAPGVMGVASLTTPNTGAVIGQNLAAGDGVTGLSTGAGIGVHGVNPTGIGVRGDSQQAQGVIGTSGQNNGVYGLAGTGGNGVFGQSGTGTGVYAQSNSGNAIFGTSGSAAGVYGQTATNNGVVGEATGGGNSVVAKSATGNALYAQATGTGNAAAFFGPVQCFGNFTVMPGFVKNGAVRFADGSVRQLYATESPENWFEDFGEAQLVNGRASVPIAADFLQAVNTTVPYYVFLTPHTEEIESLAVPLRALDHFEVRANGKGQVDGSFAYRIVAKRKDVAAPRFAPVTGHETAQAGQALDVKPSAAIPVNLPPAVAQDAAPNPWLATSFPPPAPAVPQGKLRQ